MKIKIGALIVIMFFVSCKGPTPRRPVMRKSSTYFQESVSFNKSLNQQEELAFKTYMENDSLINYQQSPNGFWYTFTEKTGNEYFPLPGDVLNFSYEVLDLENNTVYEKSFIGEQNYVMDQQDQIEGLRQGLKLLSNGDQGTFLFPSHMLYGYLGDNNKIGINQPLIYKVKLNNITKKNEKN